MRKTGVSSTPISEVANRVSAPTLKSVWSFSAALFKWRLLAACFGSRSRPAQRLMPGFAASHFLTLTALSGRVGAIELHLHD